MEASRKKPARQYVLRVAASYGHFEAVKFLFKKAASPRVSRIKFMQTCRAAVVAALEAALGFYVEGHFSFDISDRIKRRSACLPAKELSRTKANGRWSNSGNLAQRIRESQRAAEFLIDNGAPYDGTSPLFGAR